MLRIVRGPSRRLCNFYAGNCSWARWRAKLVAFGGMGALTHIIERHHAELVAIRHDLHQHPELGYEETRTSGVVKGFLSELGIKFKSGLAGGTGVVAFLPATEPGGKCIALRADMDALPIPENTGAVYASKTPGKMHACGHDGHTSILLGTARALSEVEHRPNDVLLIFQPAEEGGAGGDRMCREGVLDGKVLGRQVDRIYGLHGNPLGELGHVTSRVGPIMAAASEFRVVIHGKGGHAAYPHLSIDPIVVSAHIVTALQSIASRTISPLDSVVITIGELRAGFAHNVIPDTAFMQGTLRSLRDETDDLARKRINETICLTAQALGADATVEWVGAYPTTVNAPEVTETFLRVASRALGKDRVTVLPEPWMAGEDFAFYGQHVPACYFFLGLRPQERASYPGLHTPEFDFNDDALPTGIRLMVELALDKDLS